MPRRNARLGSVALALGVLCCSFGTAAPSTLAPAAGKGNITGLVTDMEGKPLPSLSVTLSKMGGAGGKRRMMIQDRGDNGPVATTTTGADGRYALKDIDPGNYRLMIGEGISNVVVVADKELVKNIKMVAAFDRGQKRRD